MIKKVILASAIGTMSLAASAVIANPDPVEVLQPDGTTLTIRISGDERHHILRTLDGLMITQDEEGFYRYVDLDADGHISPLGIIARNKGERKPSDMHLIGKIDQTSLLEAAENVRETASHKQADLRHSACKKTLSKTSEETLTPGIGLFDKSFPAYGEQKALVILIEYKDVSFTEKNPLDYFGRMLNEEGFSDNGATGSARDFFIYNSKGLFRPQFDVFGPVKLKGNRRDYGKNNIYGDDMNAHGMVMEACELLDDIVDFSEYDRDGDGYIDNVFIFYAGGGEHDGGGPQSAIWPHSSHISLRVSTPFILDGVQLDSYGCTSELTNKWKRTDGIGTFVHEFSHVMGLPDLYSTAYNDAVTPKSFSTLDNGSYNNEGRTPPNYSAFERQALGWMKPTEFGSDGWHILPELSESNFAYIIPSEDKNEFFLLENRNREGNDKYLPGEGMLIWRIDYDHDIWEKNQVNNVPSRQRVDLIEANNRETDVSDDSEEALQAGYPFPGNGNVTRFGHNTVPALDFRNGTETSILLSYIEYKNGAIGFVYSADGIESSGLDEVNGVSGSFRIIGREIISVDPIDVFSVSGLKIGNAQKGETIHITNPGTYIVKTESHAMKVIIE